MPELPEMETYKHLLMANIAGQMITEVQINREKSINVNPELFKNTIMHLKVLNITRRGKHLLFELQNGQVLLLHLMLGGWMFFGTDVEKPKRTIQIRLSFGEQHLYFIGLRLGYLHLYSQKEAEQNLSDLGPDPLDSALTLNEFLKRIASKHGRLKTTMLDQKFIAGIGNCYSAEICFHAGILPTKDIDDCNELNRTQLFHSMKLVLQDATKNGGYMDHPFYMGDSLTGGFYDLRKVYDREGENCYRCGSIIVMDMVSSRKTFYCQNCQK
ncbi:Fpg/Nei family DNA glycosylase [Neobacillus sp. 19]|uniref:Fpg/Nei family DNA glycosylase n=1 Tax=Neobacillus sp. 19 TaxID=3394458 RepID=UPI003BF72DB8